MNHPHTAESLRQDLRNLGISASDTLFIHSSFKSLGPVAEGAGAVIQALEKTVGPSGLILMPSFNLVDRDRRAATWDLSATPSTVGWLTEYFRRMPETHRSDHYSHSVAARGYAASAFVADHRDGAGWKSPWDQLPWGKTYGSNAPMVRAYKCSGKLLMLGVDYESSTYLHLVEVMLWNQHLEDNPEAAYIRLDRKHLGAYWDRMGRLNRGQVGGADCRLFEIRDYVDTLFAHASRKYL